MSAKTTPEIFIHTGMGRTGSTFLQYRVFPLLKGIQYTQRTRFRRAVKVIQRGKHMKYLVSGEMEYKKLERHMADFSAHFPGAKPLIILRRQDAWIASQFRRFVKSGYAMKFSEFFDTDNDASFWENEWLRYMGNIEILEKYFSQKPLVMFYDDLRDHPEEFISRIVKFLGAEIDLSKVNLNPYHRSYSEKQLRAIYTLSKKVSLVKRKPSSAKSINVLVNLLRNLLRYSTLYLAPILPSSWLSRDHFLPTPDQLNKIREYFEVDWEACRTYASLNNPDS